MTRQLSKLLVLWACVLSLVAPALAQRGGSGELEFIPAGPFQYGSVLVASGGVTIQASLVNNSNNNIDVDIPSMLGPFHFVSGSGSYTLAPGQFLGLSILYDPKRVGRDFVEILVSAEDDLILSLDGFGISSEDCGFVEPEVDMGGTTIGTPITTTVLVENQSPTTQSFTLVGGCNAFTNLSASTIDVDPGQVGQFLMEFDPDYEGGYVTRLATQCGSSAWLRGEGVAAAPKAPTDELGTTTASFRVGPNPMTDTATIRYVNAGQSAIDAELRIVDVRGRILRSEPMRIPSGSHLWQWDGRDREGQSVGAGVYFIELVAPGTTVRQKVTVLR